MAGYKEYDSSNVTLVACAIPVEDGKGDPFVKITPRGPAFEDDISSDGEVTRYHTHERRADIEVTLKRSSSHNEQFAALHAIDRESSGGAGVGGFLLKDNNGAAIFASDKCWIASLPDWEMGKGNSDVVWKLVAVLNPTGAVPGGN
jgi:hypothetical protein